MLNLLTANIQGQKQNNEVSFMKKRIILLAGLIFSLNSWAAPLGTGFSYQGELLDGGSPANGTYDFELTLYDALDGGSQVGLVENIEDAVVTNGVFSIEVDFGISPYDGDQLWILTSVRTGASGGAFTELLPRQKLTASPYALNSVQAQSVPPDSIGPLELIESGNYTVNNLTIDGALLVDSGNDIRIHDNINGFRWYDSAGTTQFANFVISGSSVTFTDSNESRTVIRSNSNGIGIGTGSPSSTHAVTIPSLNVTGQTEVGLTREVASFAVDTQVQCHSHGNLDCYYGDGIVQCPVGTKVLGGGTSGHTARYGAISRSWPNTETSWQCGISYDLSTSRNCYAICGRLE